LRKNMEWFSKDDRMVKDGTALWRETVPTFK